MSLWYQELGFFNNPFSIKPAAFKDEIVGHKIDKLLELSDNGAVLSVRGQLGTGKTTILKRLRRTFGESVIVYSAIISEKGINLPELLSMSQPWYLRITSIMPKNRILLVDEAQELKADDYKAVMRHIKRGSLKSVIFFGTGFKTKAMPQDLKKLLSGNALNLKRLSPDQAVKLVRMRIGNIKFLPDSIIKQLYKKAGNNPRRLLELCEDSCRMAVANGQSRVTNKHLKKIST